MTMKKNSEQMLDWLQKEKNKDTLELERSKQDFIDKIKQIKKEDILPKKPEKLSLWKRLKLKGFLRQLFPDDKFNGYEFIDTSDFSLTPKTPQYFDIYCQTYSLYAAIFYCLNLNLGDPQGVISNDFFKSM